MDLRQAEATNSKTSYGSSSKAKEEKTDKKVGTSWQTVKEALASDPSALSLSNHTGIDKFVHEPAWEAPWNPVGAANGSP